MSYSAANESHRHLLHTPALRTDQNSVDTSNATERTRIGDRVNTRSTRQKQIIEATIRATDRPLSIEEITASAKVSIPSINRATVYRNVKALLEKGVILKISSAHAGTLYEPNRSTHHHHFHCRSCKKTFDLPGCPLAITAPLPDNFSAESHELFYVGICGTCNSSR